MIAQFVTPSESRLREKSFSRNAEQVRSPSFISLLLDAGAYERRHLIYVVAHGRSTVRAYGHSTVRAYRRSTVHAYRCRKGTGVRIYRYWRSTILLRAY